MVCKIIFRFNIEEKKTYQMLEALEHPFWSPRIFEAKERGECFAPMVYKIILRINIEVTKIHQMLEALEHPLGSPRIFESKERGECFAPLRAKQTYIQAHFECNTF